MELRRMRPPIEQLPLIVTPSWPLEKMKLLRMLPLQPLTPLRSLKAMVLAALVAPSLGSSSPTVCLSSGLAPTEPTDTPAPPLPRLPSVPSLLVPMRLPCALLLLGDPPSRLTPPASLAEMRLREAGVVAPPGSVDPQSKRL